MKIAGRVAIVTGASSGIGAAMAVELARRGATVIGVARRADRVEAVIEQCRPFGPTAIAYPGDVSRQELAEELTMEATRRFGGVDILINNAGISPGEDPIHRTVADVERIMAVNFFGPVYLTGAVLPGMIARASGSIVNVTSVSGYVPNPGEPAYGASKAALSRWSHGLAVDLHDTGVHVGTLSPGPIDTEIWEGDATTPYEGKLYGPEIVAGAAVRMIEREMTHLTAPRHFGAVGALYPLVGAPMRWGLRKFAASQSREKR